jgi:putative tricarboxylic transport membrane protein
LRPYQVATAVAFMLVAAVAMFDSRAGALVDRSGTEPGGIGAGFYPFWSAALVLVCAGVVGYKAWSTRAPGPSAFEGRDSVLAVLNLTVPMVVATFAILWLGFYIVSGLYMALFARWIGRYSWLVTAAVAIGLPAAIYAAFEIGFRVLLPKSFLYGAGLLPF